MKTTLTDKQFKLARAFERAGLCSISQAVKAFERHDDAAIELWKKQLAEWQKKRDAEIAEAMRRADELIDGGRNEPGA